ncbi:MAG TPA: undecaprenyldiphospho-muramoylpentapeptide beta-N-acetylglucosaminyltransferase [Prevotellaceae bacterium]|nr:undecaprenyldiphospho-muramoylpentapeptide beta-N-acetylglucosaminyltransferase [Prevotellaceae bacterium]
MEEELKVIISGGGTGGHIFPAISIANALKAIRPNVKILFVGAEGRMEMTRVPAAGYEIKGLPVSGFDRKHLMRNIKVLYRAAQSRMMAKKILHEFKPQVAVGVGGYASGPMLSACESSGIPILLQEQNSYPGVTNKILARKADKICVAYDNMEKFFPASKIILTGNPVRQELLSINVSREVAIKSFGLDPSKKTILIIGGSLGAKTINDSVLTHLSLIKQSNVQFIWQTGKFYSEQIREELEKKGKPDNLYVSDFIADMAKAYKAADLVISRAGASSISELCLLGKPCILVPSPNVAEDHQTKNALALVKKDAAIYIKDSEAQMALLPKAVSTVNEPERLVALSRNIISLAHPDAARIIAEEVIRLAKEKKQAQHSN